MSAFKILWEKTLNYLEEDLPVFQYNVWIKDLKPFQEDDSTYFFEVSSNMHKSLMSEKYESSIKNSMERALEELYGLPIDTFELQFITPEEIDAKIHGGNSESASTTPQPVAEPPTQSQKTEQVATMAREEQQKEASSKAQMRANLNPNHSFDTFVVGESNKLANAAAHAVASAPGHAYNPLFIYGGVGLGKTHLLHAVGNKILDQKPNTTMVYVTSETFTNELIHMISKTNTSSNIDMREQFRDKYRKVDVLMIDDIQFIAGKDKTQDEFFHTFNALHEINKQIIITSDRPPKEIKHLEERMRSRFEWGLIADIKMPDYETRVAILLKKTQLMRVDNMLPINEEVHHYIAQHEDTNIRTLEGALQKVMMYAELHREEQGLSCIDLSIAERALEDYFAPPAHKAITPDLIMDVVCRYYDVAKNDILGTKRSRDITFPRQIAMYLVRDMTELSYENIAESFNKKDHTTIMHAENKIKDEMKDDPSLKRSIDDIVEKIKS